MKKQNKIYLGIGIVAIVLIVAIMMFSNQEKEEDTIKIGAIYPLSGDLAFMGVEYQRGLQMAAEEINSQGGIDGKEIELIFEDGKNDAKESISSFNKLVNVNNVDYIFTAFSGPASALAPLAKQHKIIMFYSSTINIGDGKYVFKDYWDMEDQGQEIGEHISRNDFSTIGAIAMKHPSTPVFFDGLKKGLGQNDIELIREDFELGMTDFKTPLLKIKESNPEALIVHVLPGKEAELIIKNLAELNMTYLQLYSGTAAYSNLRAAKKYPSALNKLKAIDTYYGVSFDSEKTKLFNEEYLRMYGEDLIGDVAYPYDDLHALRIAIEKSPENNVAEELLDLNYDGVAGNLKFDAEGNSIRKARIVQFDNGEWININ